MKHLHSFLLCTIAFSLVFAFVLHMYEAGITAYAIKTLHKPELVSAPAAWVERRYICDLPNRQDCIDCCEAVRTFAKGPAVLMDFESCIAKMPKRKIDDTAHVWEDCIRVASGLKPKYGLVEVVEELPVPETPAEMPFVPELALPPVQEQPQQLPPTPLQEQQAPVQIQPLVREPDTLAPYVICSLLRKKPERPLVFMPFHPLMVASVVC